MDEAARQLRTSTRALESQLEEKEVQLIGVRRELEVGRVSRTTADDECLRYLPHLALPFLPASPPLPPLPPSSPPPLPPVPHAPSASAPSPAPTLLPLLFPVPFLRSPLVC